VSIAALLRQVKKRLAKLTRSRRRSSAGNPSFETLALAGSVADRYKHLQRNTLHFVTDYLEKVSSRSLFTRAERNAPRGGWRTFALEDNERALLDERLAFSGGISATERISITRITRPNRS
jgi:hypothetical protein